MAKQLSEKIDKPEDMPDVWLRRDFRAFNPVKGGMVQIPPPWWLKREWARIEGTIYPEPTTAIEALNNQNPQYALHISREDKNFIAYTPDKSFGERDAQLKTTLGKFIAKYYPHIKDDMVRDICAAHAGEISGEFELITGAAISEAYRELGNRGACMSYADDRYSGMADHRPTDVYDMPNIALAVIRNSDGSIKARAMVYTPSEDDKRYIRIYLDSQLETRLRRAGYRPGTWHGAEFKAIVVGASGDKDRVVLPYLDGNGAAGGPAVSQVAYMGGKLLSVTSAMAVRIRRVSPDSVVTATSTGGSVWLQNLVDGDFNKVCPMSGQTYNELTAETEKAYMDGKVVDILEGTALGPFYYQVDTLYRRQSVSVWAARSEPTFKSSRYGRMIASPDAIVQYGLKKMHPTYYPEDSGDYIYLVGLYSADQQAYKVCGNYLIKTVDAVAVIQMVDMDEGGQTPKKVWIHQEEIDQTYTKVHSEHAGKPFYAKVGVPVEKTASGRKVVAGVHAVVRLVTGGLEFSRNTDEEYFMGQSFYVLKKDNNPAAFDGAKQAMISARLEEYMLKENQNLKQAMWTFAGNYCSYSLYIDGTVYYADEKREKHPSVEKLLESAQVRDSSYSKHMKYWYNMKLAEMSAVDYNLPQEVPAPAITLPEAEIATEQVEEEANSVYI